MPTTSVRTIVAARSMKPRPLITPQPRSPSCRVIDYGTPCPSCGERYTHKVVNTYEGGKKRKRCLACGTKFVTVQVDK